MASIGSRLVHAGFLFFLGCVGEGGGGTNKLAMWASPDRLKRVGRHHCSQMWAPENHLRRSRQSA